MKVEVVREEPKPPKVVGYVIRLTPEEANELYTELWRNFVGNPSIQRLANDLYEEMQS